MWYYFELILNEPSFEVPFIFLAGEDFNVVQREVENLLNNRILVGHSLGNDFSVLKFKHPKSLVRDTSVYQYFRSKAGVKNNPKLKVLAQVMLGINIQVKSF